jgi:hypothetical protein
MHTWEYILTPTKGKPSTVGPPFRFQGEAADTKSGEIVPEEALETACG